MRKRGIVIIVLLIISVTGAIITLLKGSPEPEVVVHVEEVATPINFLLNNDMSAFDETERFDRDIRNFMRRWELTGASFALMRNDSLLYAKGYGFADRVDSVECDVNHVFRVASVSKLLTATAIMKLNESGRLSLDDQVFGAEGILSDSIFLDLQSRNHEKITVEHLLRHTAGFSTALGDPAFSNDMAARKIGRSLPLSLDDMILFATKINLRWRPGDTYRYSNLGYLVLTKIVERVSGMSYESYVKESILEPIGCYDMHIGRNFSENLAPNEVNYYEVKEAEPVEAYDGSGRMTMKSDGGNNVTLLSGAGGWVASPTELLRFVASIDGNSIKADILSEESIEKMTYDSKRYKPIGWATVRGEEWIRSGSMSGTTALVKHQKDGYTWVLLLNNSAWIGHNLTKYISSQVSRSIAAVKHWPKRDLFEITPSEVAQFEIGGESTSPLPDLSPLVPEYEDSYSCDWCSPLNAR